MMPGTISQQIPYSTLISSRIKAFLELLKIRLSSLVAFSSGFGYLLATGKEFGGLSFALFILGGFLVSGSAITINQILERQYDGLMKRTAGRPLPTQRISVNDARIYAILLGLAGAGIIYWSSGAMAAMISLISWVLYSFIYTPLKRVGPIAVFVGAIPGALPPLIGWVAATGSLSIAAWAVFAIQFIWQFPHFWAIAWLADEDYRKAGFKLLPASGKPNLASARYIMISSLILLPAGLIPLGLGISGSVSAWIAIMAGALFAYQTLALVREKSRISALRIMYASFLYLPLVQIAFLLDRI